MTQRAADTQTAADPSFTPRAHGAERMTEAEDKPNHDETVALLEQIAGAACTSLFEAYGVDLQRMSGPEPTPTAPAPILYSGIVGFGSPGIRGACILAASEKPILQSNPVDGSLRDWIAELANQLVGRIKNKLLAHGTEVYVTTPVVLRGEHLAPMPRRELPPLSFKTDGGSVFVWIELETAADFVLGPPSTAVAEGEAVLF
jgi:hypothetical protein